MVFDAAMRAFMASCLAFSAAALASASAESAARARAAQPPSATVAAAPRLSRSLRDDNASQDVEARGERARRLACGENALAAAARTNKCT